MPKLSTFNSVIFVFSSVTEQLCNFLNYLIAFDFYGNNDNNVYISNSIFKNAIGTVIFSSVKDYSQNYKQNINVESCIIENNIIDYGMFQVFNKSSIELKNSIVRNNKGLILHNSKYFNTGEKKWSEYLEELEYEGVVYFESSPYFSTKTDPLEASNHWSFTNGKFKVYSDNVFENNTLKQQVSGGITVENETKGFPTLPTDKAKTYYYCHMNGALYLLDGYGNRVLNPTDIPYLTLKYNPSVKGKLETLIKYNNEIWASIKKDVGVEWVDEIMFSNGKYVAVLTPLKIHTNAFDLEPYIQKNGIKGITTKGKYVDISNEPYRIYTKAYFNGELLPEKIYTGEKIKTATWKQVGSTKSDGSYTEYLYINGQKMSNSRVSYGDWINTGNLIYKGKSGNYEKYSQKQVLYVKGKATSKTRYIESTQYVSPYNIGDVVVITYPFRFFAFTSEINVTGIITSIHGDKVKVQVLVSENQDLFGYGQTHEFYESYIRGKVK